MPAPAVPRTHCKKGHCYAEVGFYQRKGSRLCRPCTKAAGARVYQKHKTERRERALRSRRLRRKEYREMGKRYRREYGAAIAARAQQRFEADPDLRLRINVRQRTRYAIARGWIRGVPGKHFHHPDYAQPLLGVWLTPEEHQLVHAGRMPCPTPTDYTEQVARLRQQPRVSS